MVSFYKVDLNLEHSCSMLYHVFIKKLKFICESIVIITIKYFTLLMVGDLFAFYMVTEIDEQI